MRIQIAPCAQTPDRRPACRSCVTRKANRPRGLCWACYSNPATRDLYSRLSPWGVGLTGSTEAPAWPTTAAPGTIQKAKAMAGRAALGQSLFHTADARWDGDLRPVEWLAMRQASGTGNRVSDDAICGHDAE